MYGSSHSQNIHDKSQCAQTIMHRGTPTTVELTNLPMISKPNLVATEQQVRRIQYHLRSGRYIQDEISLQIKKEIFRFDIMISKHLYKSNYSSQKPSTTWITKRTCPNFSTLGSNQYILLTNAAFLSAFLFMSISSIGRDQVNGVSVRFSRIWSRILDKVWVAKVAEQQGGHIYVWWWVEPLQFYTLLALLWSLSLRLTPHFRQELLDSGSCKGLLGGNLGHAQH